MPSGITGASITTLTNGTTANASDVMSSLNSLKNNGVNNDGGNIATDSAGNMTLVGVIAMLQNNTAGTVLNGSTSGTATLYQIITGTYKKVIIFLNNFRNGSAPAQTIVFPTAFTKCAEIHSWQMATYQLLSSASAITLYYLSSFSSGFGVTSLTTVGFAVDAILRTNGVQAFDTISFGGSQSSASTGFAIIEGI